MENIQKLPTLFCVGSGTVTLLNNFFFQFLISPLQNFKADIDFIISFNIFREEKYIYFIIQCSYCLPVVFL